MAPEVKLIQYNVHFCISMAWFVFLLQENLANAR